MSALHPTPRELASPLHPSEYVLAYRNNVMRPYLTPGEEIIIQGAASKGDSGWKDHRAMLRRYLKSIVAHPNQEPELLKLHMNYELRARKAPIDFMGQTWFMLKVTAVPRLKPLDIIATKHEGESDED